MKEFTQDEIRDLIMEGASHSKYGWYGDSYQFHPRGILIWDFCMWDEWNSNKYTYIAVSSVRGAKWKPAVWGRDASCSYHGGALPRLIDAEKIIVWSYSGWFKQWPFKELIFKILEELEIEINENKEAVKRKEEEYKQKKKEELQKKEESLLAQYSTR